MTEAPVHHSTQKKDQGNANAAAARVLRIMALLPGHALTGISNKALSEALKTSPTNISRALKTMEQEGFATCLDNGLWGPTVKLLAMCMAHAQHTENIKRRADELQQQAFSRAQHYFPS